MPKKTITITITLEQLELTLYKALIDGETPPENVAKIVQQIKAEVVQKSSDG